eukprot:365304-Chlamydomonas_euryale.AAC.6
MAARECRRSVDPLLAVTARCPALIELAAQHLRHHSGATSVACICCCNYRPAVSLLKLEGTLRGNMRRGAFKDAPPGRRAAPLACSAKCRRRCLLAVGLNN